MTVTDAVSTALDVVQTAGVMRFAMTPAEAQGWAVSVREMKRSVLVDGSDYAVIPGTTKPSLLKPGAEMLLLAAGLGFTMLKVEDAGDVERGGVSYRCSVHRGTRDNVVAECEGYAGYDEDRFFQSAATAEAKERANAERYQRKVNQAKCVEYRAPWNSVVKMAQKRALVGAALNACAASGLFTQDLEDDRPLPPLWDATVVVKPYVDGLNSDQAAELKGWWRTADNGRSLPALAALTAEQGARVLVQVGLISNDPPPCADDPDDRGNGGPTPPPASSPPPTPPAPVPSPPAAVQAPPTPVPGPAPSVVEQLDAALERDKASRPVPQPPAGAPSPGRSASSPLPGTADRPGGNLSEFWQPNDDGPRLVVGVTDSDLIGGTPLLPEDRERMNRAWTDHGGTLAARLDYLGAKMGVGPASAKFPPFGPDDEGTFDPAAKAARELERKAERVASRAIGGKR